MARSTRKLMCSATLLAAPTSCEKCSVDAARKTGVIATTFGHHHNIAYGQRREGDSAMSVVPCIAARTTGASRGV